MSSGRSGIVEPPGHVRRGVRRPAASKPYMPARRSAFCRGTVKPVSLIPIGPKIRRSSTSPSGASSMRAMSSQRRSVEWP